MSINERLRRWGQIEVPLSSVCVLMAFTIVMLNKPQKEIHYVVVGGKVAEITGSIIETNQSFKEMK